MGKQYYYCQRNFAIRDHPSPLGHLLPLQNGKCRSVLLIRLALQELRFDRPPGPLMQTSAVTTKQWMNDVHRFRRYRGRHRIEIPHWGLYEFDRLCIGYLFVSVSDFLRVKVILYLTISYIVYFPL